MIDVLVIYGGYFIVASIATLAWFGVGEWFLRRRELDARAREAAPLLDERDAYEDFTARDGQTVLYVVQPHGELIDAEQRFAARRAQAMGPMGGGAA